MTHFNTQNYARSRQVGISPLPYTDIMETVTSLQWAEMIAKSSICPPAYKGKPYDIIVAIQFGRSIGLAWVQPAQYCHDQWQTYPLGRCHAGFMQAITGL